ncbi:MAG: hypothetical protein LBK99_05485 [Opitutaceae bacterium]|nr:hypothetical protein [Opitutaceae bacterium]
MSSVSRTTKNATPYRGARTPFLFFAPVLPGSPPELRRNNYRIRISATHACAAGLPEEGKLIPHPAFPQDESLAHPQLANAVIHYGLRSNEAVLYPAPDSPDRLEKNPVITIRHRQEQVPPPTFAFVTWSPSPDAPFYCIEPWMGPSNAPGHGVGLHRVHPVQQHAHTVSITISPLP